MAQACDAAASLEGLVDVADVVAIGPGLRQDAWGNGLFTALIDNAKPRVVDADAINILATSPRQLQADTVLTPHPGEAARLLSIQTHEVQADRRAAALALCERFGCVVVLKGAGPVVAAPGRIACLIAADNPGMAVCGMGNGLNGLLPAVPEQGLGE